MQTWNRTAVVVVPSQPFLDWLHSVDPTSTDLALADLREDPTVYLLPGSGSDSEATSLLAKTCARIFEETTQLLVSCAGGVASRPQYQKLRTLVHVQPSFDDCGPVR